MTASETDLASDLIVEAARLLRLARRHLSMPAGTRVLAILDQHGELTIGALAEHDGCSQPTMSAQIASLEQSGLVARSADPNDARRSLIGPTPAGRAALAEVRATGGAWAAGRLAGHSVPDLRTAVAVLRAINEGAR